MDSATLIHLMNTAIRYSADVVVENNSLDTAACALELSWFSQFWLQAAMKADGASGNEMFRRFFSYMKLN